MITETSAALIQACLCGATTFEEDLLWGIPVRRCACGIVHQAVAMTPAEYEAFYREKYLREVYTHDDDHDYAVAQMRLDRHGDLYRGRTLDVGTGYGAFVRAARERGFESYGQDIAEAGQPFTYHGPIESLYFPTDYFQTVTINDVLEHVPDPKALLAEVFRLTDQEGWCIIDVPDFWCFEGQHHWKPTEHLWFFTLPQLHALVSFVGLEVERVDHPIPGKTVLYCRKPKQKRVSILVPPGIGDSYWSITKIRGFCATRNLGLPDVFVAAPDDKKRSLEFIRKIPFLKAAGYREHSTKSAVFQEAYMKDGRTVFSSVSGCDYFIAFNGVMRFGKTVDAQLPECATEWYPPMFRSLKQRAAAAAYRERFGDYVVAYFIPHGMYKFWLKEFPEAGILESLQRIQSQLNCRVVFIGSSWDKQTLAARLTAAAADLNFIDLTGQTDIDEMLALFEGSTGVIGFPSGATILAAALGRPTLMLWNQYFVEPFWRYACPPDSLGRWYQPINTAGATPESVRAAFIGLLETAAGSKPVVL